MTPALVSAEQGLQVGALVLRNARSLAAVKCS